MSNFLLTLLFLSSVGTGPVHAAERCPSPLPDLEEAGFEVDLMRPVGRGPDSDVSAMYADASAAVVAICGSHIDALDLAGAALVGEGAGRAARVVPAGIVEALGSRRTFIVIFPMPSAFTSVDSWTLAYRDSRHAFSRQSAPAKAPPCGQVQGLEPSITSAALRCGMGVAMTLHTPVTPSIPCHDPLESPDVEARGLDGIVYGTHLQWHRAGDVCRVQLLMLTGRSRDMTFHARTALVGNRQVDLSWLRGSYSVGDGTRGPAHTNTSVLTAAMVVLTMLVAARRATWKPTSRPHIAGMGH